MQAFRQLAAIGVIALAFLNNAMAQEPAAAPLEVTVYNADANSFHVNSVLITGKEDVVLIDTQFTRADAHRLAAEILKKGKNLKTIYVSHGDPAYYFGLEVLKAAFPEANIYASEPTIAWIRIPASTLPCPSAPRSIPAK